MNLSTITLPQTPSDVEIAEDATNTFAAKDRDFTVALPDELLMQIFIVYQNWTRIHFDGPRPIWLIITQICRRWRNIALAFPIYWNVVPTYHLGCTEAMISRSQNVPVSIDFSIKRWNQVDTIPPGAEIALQQVHRASNIHIFLNRGAIDQVVERLNDAQMPLLTEFKLIFKRGNTNVLESYDLPVSFLRADHAPLLSAMRLSHCGLSFDTVVPPNNITRLEFAHIPRLRRPTTSRYRDLLSGMPQLEVFIVDYAGPLLDDLASDRKVSLPCLRHLTLVDTIRSCVTFGHHLDLPSSASLRLLAVQDIAPGSAEFGLAASLERDIVNLVDQHCAGWRKERAAASEELTTLHIDESLFMSLSVRLGGDDMEAEAPPLSRASPAYDIAVSWPRVPEFPRVAAAVLMSRLCDSLPTMHVHTMRVDGPFSISARRWNVTFGAMERVRAVSLVGDAVYGFVEAFSQFDTKHSGSYNSSRLFPALDDLTIDCAELVGADGQSAIYDALKDGLRRRRESRDGKKMDLHIPGRVLPGSQADELAVDANVDRLPKSAASVPDIHFPHDPGFSGQIYHDGDLDGI
ncbi:hypothetical protein EWM64_g6253 [Hericium alpestre]|uniref:Uncharacterized protein n=1 Tax=Hericium alpestre TaxID=135208 RepID=A0A4Y9ZUL4_9AGAM|nr:hypothetical protein EWM64_g6253 [Hericium alpestre]